MNQTQIDQEYPNEQSNYNKFETIYRSEPDTEALRIGVPSSRYLYNEATSVSVNYGRGAL